MGTPLNGGGGGGGGVAVLPNTVNPVDSAPTPSKKANVHDFDFPSPILMFVLFHRAIRSELDILHRVVLAFATGQQADIHPMLGRYCFLRSVYKHHSQAEDEVIFSALDKRVKNVAQTYSLEHKGESDLFNQLFELLNCNNLHDTNVRRQLASCTGALQTSLCQHMAKEEEQVFPLLIENFSFTEQASLVWQFFCSIPVNMMAEFLPWISSSLSLNDYQDMSNCLCNIVPNEKLLQQVVFTWMDGQKDTLLIGGKTKHPMVHGTASYSSIPANESVNLKSICNDLAERIKEHPDLGYDINQNLEEHPIDVILHWHKAIEKELHEIVAEAKKLKLTENFINLSSFYDSLHFLADVWIFHSIAEDEVIFPAVDGEFSFTEEHAEEATQFNKFSCLIENIQTYGEASASGAEFNDKLCSYADVVIETTQKHFRSEENKVLPLVRKHFSKKRQCELLYQSLCVMPLKLIERVLPWLVGSLTENEAKSFLKNICLAAPAQDHALVTLFSGWACKGHNCRVCLSSSTTSCYVEKASAELDSCLLGTRPSSSSEILLPCQKDGNCYKRPVKRRALSGGEGHVVLHCPNESCSVPCLGVNSTNHLGLSCTKFARSLSSISSAPSLKSNLFIWEAGTPSSSNSDTGSTGRPIDTIFKFHKAISKDLEYLDIESGKFSNEFDGTFLRQFIGRFRLLWGFYRAHSNAEDEIVFPALESKEALHNVSHSYTLDHMQEEKLFKDISKSLSELSHFHEPSDGGDECDSSLVKYGELTAKLQGMCKSVRITLDQHIFREELELWPLFSKHFTDDEQDKLLGRIIGTTGAEVLQSMLPWVTSALSAEEQNLLLDSWKNAAKNTMFHEWLKECSWENTSVSDGGGGGVQSRVRDDDDDDGDGNEEEHMFKPGWRDIFRMNQNELELEARKVYRDSTLDPRRKSYLVQHLMTSCWIAAQQNAPRVESAVDGRSRSYRDKDRREFGCEHYKRNCKLRAACCRKLFTCRFCHDKVSDHSMDRKAISEMMCMGCLNIQPVGPFCITPSCKGRSMAKYYCSICRFFDDERAVYHCPFCNLCRVGQGLGVDYFHCMTCNCCMGMKLVDHKCLERGMESDCPICCDFLFTSSAAVRALACGHFMHSACFQAYTCSHYTCPICSKSMGDMGVYFGMLDALLAVEELPEEYREQNQDVLCNDCGLKGTSPFHWLYHKCSRCGSYNTRLL